VNNDQGFDIRWFTPSVEVDLCGHATLASAHVLFTIRKSDQKSIVFNSKSGPLTVVNHGDHLTMDFPADVPTSDQQVPGLLEALGLSAGKIFRGKTDFMVVLNNQEDVINISPDFPKLKQLPVRGVIVTASGNDTDFVSRFFAPASGIDEDPVTGSAHCTLTPYWSERLGKTKLTARQLSTRVGELGCELVGDRVKLSGTAVTYLTGIIHY
jgi:PhzF family phenazine biosynthesis protein